MKSTALFALAVALASLEAAALTVEEAYAAIPHQRTAFEPKASKLPPAQKESLERLFRFSDRGVVLRVEGMRAQVTRDSVGLKRVLERYDQLIESLESATLAPEVAPARDRVAHALKIQRGFLASKPQGGMRFLPQELHASAQVREASQDLHGAYGILMRAFPGEPARNQSSFFDHLCALDYL